MDTPPSFTTPEFLLWSIEHACPLRGFESGRDPERIERQLRGVRAVSDARREGRVFEGLCLDPPDGFRIDDALAHLGGLEGVDAACGACPVNVPRDGALAGCYGLVPLPADEQTAHREIERAAERAELADEIARHFPPTVPTWYGLWIASPLSATQAAVIEQLLAAVTSDDVALCAGLADLRAGLVAARSAAAAVHVRLFPRGRVEGTWWRLEIHCPHCRAPWRNEQCRQCRVCGYVGHPAPQKKRRVRGRRPYFPLGRLLGEEAARGVWRRYDGFLAAGAAG
jgi:hypothetical protein